MTKLRRSFLNIPLALISQYFRLLGQKKFHRKRETKRAMKRARLKLTRITLFLLKVSLISSVYKSRFHQFRILQAPVVQTLDSAIHWINHYPLDNSIGFASVYPLDSDLSGGQRYPSFEQLGPE